MRAVIMAVAMLLTASGCASGDDSKGNPCLLGGGAPAEVFRDGEKIELLATATLSKAFAMVDAHPVWVEQLTIVLSIEKYESPSQEECVQKVTLAISNPAVGEAEIDILSKDGASTYNAVYGWGNSDLDGSLDNAATGNLTEESQLVISEFGEGYVSGTFRLVWSEGVVLEDGKFDHVPVAGGQ